MTATGVCFIQPTWTDRSASATIIVSNASLATLTAPITSELISGADTPSAGETIVTIAIETGTGTTAVLCTGGTIVQ